MNWNNFALGLMYNKIPRPTKAQKISFIVNIFEHAMKTSDEQYCPYISEDAVKNWLSKEQKGESVKPQIRKYFPSSKMEELGSEELLRFLHSQISYSFQKCQNKFWDIKKEVETGKFTYENYIVKDTNDNFCIDCDTTDEGQFLISLINQFSTLMGLPNITYSKKLLSSVDFLSVDAPKETQQYSENQVTPTSSISDLEFCRSTEMVEQDESDHTVIERDTHFLSELAIPKECYICSFCKYWQVKSDIFRIMTSPVYGICTMRNNSSKLSTTEKCDCFVPHYGRIELASLKNHIQNF